MKVLEVSAKTGEGMDAWLRYLETCLVNRRQERH
jgi:hypothetical protein